MKKFIIFGILFFIIGSSQAQLLRFKADTLKAVKGVKIKGVDRTTFFDRIDSNNQTTTDVIGDETITLQKLTEALKLYVGSGGNVVNMPDDSTTAANADSTIYVKEEFLGNTEVGRQGYSSKTVNLRTHVENNNVVNALDYGAIPNDGLDDSTPIQNAINAGYTVYIPAGIYNVSNLTMARRGQRLVGQGSQRTSSTGTAFYPAVNDAPIITLGAGLQMEIIEISFYGKTATDTARYGIYIDDGGSGHTIAQCEFEQFSYGSSSTQWNSIPYPDTAYAIYNYSTFDVHVQFCRFYRNDVHYRGVGGTQVTQFYGCEMFGTIINAIWLQGGSTFAFYGGNLEAGEVYSGYDAFVRLENVYSFSFYDWSSETGNPYAAYNTHTNPGANDSLNIGWIKISHPNTWTTITAENGGVITLDSAMTAKSGNDTIKVSDWAETQDILTQIGDTLRIGSEKMVLYRYPAAGNIYWYVHRLGTPSTHSVGDTVEVSVESSVARTNIRMQGGGFSGGSYHSIMRAHLPVVFDLTDIKRPVTISLENVWTAEFLEDMVRYPDDQYLANNVNLTIRNSYIRDVTNNYSYIDYISNIDTRDIPDTTSWFKGYGGGHFANTVKFGNPLILERQDAYNHTPQAHLTIYQDNDGGYFEPYDNKYSLKFSGPHPYSGSAANYDYAAVYSNATTQADFNWNADSSRTIIFWAKPQRLVTGGGSSYIYEVPNEGSFLYTSAFKVFRQWHSGTYLNGGIFDEFDNGVTEIIYYYGQNVAYFERGRYPRENQWTMFAYVREANTNNSPDGRVIGYMDGAYHYEQNMPYDETWGVVPQIMRYVNGQFDDLAVYRGCLTAAQIDSIYNKGKCPDLENYPASAKDSLLCWFDFEYSNFGTSALRDTIRSVTDPANEYVLIGNGSDAGTKAQLVKDSPTYMSFIQGYTETSNNREGDDVLFEVDKDGYVQAQRYYISDQVYIVWSDSVYVINEAVPDTFVIRSKK